MPLISTLRLLARDLIRVDRSKAAPEVAARNTLGVFLPLALGALTGHLLVGVTVTTGALNVAFSDRPGPYTLRLRRMMLASLAGALSAALGVATGHIAWLTLAMLAVWAFGGGLLAAFGPAAEQIGLTSIVVFIVYGGLGLAPESAALDACFILIGGLIQTFLAVAGWATDPRRPERHAVSSVFRALANLTRSTFDPNAAPPVSSEITAASTTLSEVMARRDDVLQLRALLDEGERIRLELLTLQDAHLQLEEGNGNAALRASIEAITGIAREVLDRVADAVDADVPVKDGEVLIRRAEDEARRARAVIERGKRCSPVDTAPAVLAHLDALAGQLRAAVAIASTEAAETAHAGTRTERGLAGALGWQGSLQTLRDNLTIKSPSFRHGVRLAAALTICEALGMAFHLGRFYWIPLTAAIVLKPDFKSTFTRGLGRGVGTLIGLIVATGLTYAVGASVAGRVLLIGVLTFFIRLAGPMNFGVAAVGITALVVALTSFAGYLPETTIIERGVNTVIGTCLALLAYATWPTWERTRATDVLRDLLQAYRRYFDSVVEAYVEPERTDRARLDETRYQARVARANAESSVSRLEDEPVGGGEDLDLMNGVLANSHRFALSSMALEAGLYTAQRPPLPILRPFAEDVDTMIDRLTAKLQGDRSSAEMPDLRAEQRRMLESIDGNRDATALLRRVIPETERVTNSLNTILDVISKHSDREPASSYVDFDISRMRE